MSKNKYPIDLLISKKKRGDINAKEEKYLQRWSDKDPENEQLYNKLMDSKYVLKEMKVFYELDKTRESAVRKILNILFPDEV